MKIVILCIIFSLALAGQAHAYIDPGTGSGALQALLAIIFTGLASIRVYWKQIKNFFSSTGSKNSTEDNKSGPSASSEDEE